MKRIVLAIAVLSLSLAVAPAPAEAGCFIGKLFHGAARVAGVHRRQERRAARQSANASYVAGGACAVRK